MRSGYCRGSSIENSPFRMRALNPSVNFAAASSPYVVTNSANATNKARLREAIAVDSFVARLGPGFLKVAQCHMLLLAIGNRLARFS